MQNKSEHYFDLHHKRANEGAKWDELNDILGMAHYYLRDEGEPYIPAIANHGSDVIELDRQMEKPN